MTMLTRWILQHLLFAGTVFFAAGSSAIGDAGGGGGDGAAIGGTDSGGTDGAAIGETPAGDGAGTGQGADDLDDTAEIRVDGDAADPETLVALDGDGRQVPQKYKEIFKNDKFLKGLFFQDKVLRQAYPGGVKEAVQAKQAFDEMGGPEGVQEMQNEVKEFRATDELFMAGDPKLMDRMFQLYPESTAKLVQAGLEKWSGADKDTYNHVMGRVVFNTLSTAQPMHEAYNLLAALKDNPQAQEAAKQLASWYNGIRDVADKVPEKKVDPKAKELDERESKLKETEQRQRVESINAAVRPKLMTAMETALAQEFKVSGLNFKQINETNPGGVRRLMANIMQEVKARVLSDQRYVDNYESALAEGNQAKALKLFEQKHSKVVHEASATIWKEFAPLFGVKGAVKRPAMAASMAGANGNGVTQMSAMPDRMLINWGHPGTKVIDKVAVLKDGKKVSWA